jgi:hypothetical protein
MMTTLSRRQPLDPARQAAYRRLALTILGVDVHTLTTELRAQREAAVREARPALLPLCALDADRINEIAVG